MLPYWRQGGNVTEKTTRRLRGQFRGLSVVFGVGSLVLLLSGGTKRLDDFLPFIAKKSSAPDRSPELAITVHANITERRLHAAGSVTISECSKPSTTAACGGQCIDYATQKEVDDLAGWALMIDPNGLTQPSNPKLKDSHTWWFPWYVFNIFYMFCALAIVCDEFFVPALESFVDEFGISMDVAGATFMAAGGSMPELFTSLIATFQESTVGFAAIVGSAVFNVLFVIAVCAIFSDEVLVLTWWPLTRDCSFYLVALITVVFVFSNNDGDDKEIVTWEALLLLSEYVMYCTFMKFNSRIAAYVEGKCASVRAKVLPDSYSSGEDSLASGAAPEANPHFARPGSFRVGIVQLLTQNAYIHETAGIAAVTQIAGDLDATFKSLDTDGDGMLDTDEIKGLLIKLHIKPDSATIKSALKRITRTGADRITFEAFKKWYLASEARIESEVQRIFDNFDKDKNGLLDGGEIQAVMKLLGHKTNDAEILAFMKEIQHIAASSPMQDTTESSPPPPEIGPATSIDMAKINLEQFERWYEQSLFYENKKRQNEIEEQAASGAINLDPPSRQPPSGDMRIDSKNKRMYYSAMFWYVLTYPLVCVMYCTLPDVRQEKWHRNWKIAVTEFALSLVWIGIFSNWLYECIVVCSNTIGIDPAISAVTVLAAGTSVPDLLSSYIVAKNGEGDMAVSSSIGSNIFDVTVGLPLPWLLYNLIKGKPAGVNSDSLGRSMIVLVGMVAMVILTIMCMKWRMTRSMGYIMLVFYFLFLVQDLGGQIPKGDPLFKF